MAEVSEIELLGSGGLQPAKVSLSCRKLRENTFSLLHHIRLWWEWGEVEAQCSNYYTTFVKIRRQLDPCGLYPVCYGAGRKAVVTGMCLEQSSGLLVYWVAPDELSKDNWPMVQIFDSGPDVEPVSVEEQEKIQAAFWQRRRSQK